MNINEIEDIRKKALTAAMDQTTGYLYLGAIGESQALEHIVNSNEDVLFKKFFMTYVDALDVQVDEYGCVI